MKIANERFKEILRNKYPRIFNFLKDIKYNLRSGHNFRLISYYPEKNKQNSIKNISFLIGCLEGESKRYRVFNIIEMLKMEGIAANTFYEINISDYEKALECDLLVLFRTAYSDNIKKLIELSRKKGVPVIFDIDDYIFEPAIIDKIDAIKNFNSAEKELYFSGLKKYQETLINCDYCTSPTRYLSEKMSEFGKKSFIIPNTINKNQFHESINFNKNVISSKQIKLGYFSGSYTHNKDFDLIKKAILDLLEKYKNLEFHVVGMLKLDKSFSQYKKQIKYVDFMPYIKMLKYLSKMDINIAPLELDNPFNEGKSELKIFEAGLMGIPTVASPTFTYSQYILDGVNGFLATTVNEWVNKISFLIENSVKMKEIGDNIKEDVIKRNYTVTNSKKIIKIYEDILLNYKKNEKN